MRRAIAEIQDAGIEADIWKSRRGRALGLQDARRQAAAEAATVSRASFSAAVPTMRRSTTG